MTIQAMCTTCQRTVYISADDTPVCPVCSSPLLETVDSLRPPADEDEEDAEDADESV